MAEEKLITQEEADDQLINEAFEKLLKDYLNSRHRKKVDLITKAFNFARQAHKGVRRLSGEPYITLLPQMSTPQSLEAVHVYLMCKSDFFFQIN